MLVNHRVKIQMQNKGSKSQPFPHQLRARQENLHLVYTEVVWLIQNLSY